MSEPKATLIFHTPNYMDIIAGAMSKCYEKKAGHKAVIKHAIEAGHYSSLEHAMATIDIECSLAVLGQITRHRHLSPTVKSSRGAEFKGDYVIPDGLTNEQKTVYGVSIESSLLVYSMLIENGAKHEDAAYVLPKGMLTKMRLSGNLRAWYEYLPKRLCRRAMPEHRQLAQLIHKELATAMPEIFDRDFMKCASCQEHGCEFH